MEEVKENVFAPVLGSDEEIIEIFKPNKKREVTIKLIFTSIILLLFAAIPFVIGLLGILGIIEFTEEIVDDLGNVSFIASPMSALPILIFGCVFILIWILTIISTLVSYKKRWYCYTNKRVIVRSGFIGVDYQTLDYELIGGISVNVSLLDKFVKPETGTISFASAASPVVQNSKGISSYVFTSIENPYEVYRRIKEYLDNSKK